jgi:hypothetical protein
MDNGILTSVKLQLSLMPEDDSFDDELVIHINAAFSVLTQLGVGPKEGFSITGQNETWDDYAVDIVQASMAKQYVYLKVRMLFDPPSNSTVFNKMKEMAEEYEWRLRLQAEV